MSSSSDQLPSKDVDLPTLMAWLRERHSYLVGLGAKETYEGLIHAHIERLERRLNECGLECSEGLKRLAAENERLRTTLTGIASGASCEMCRGAAQRALGEPTCVHPFHRLKLDDGGVMWCRECEATLLLIENFGGAAQPPGDVT